MLSKQESRYGNLREPYLTKKVHFRLVICIGGNIWNNGKENGNYYNGLCRDYDIYIYIYIGNSNRGV